MQQLGSFIGCTQRKWFRLFLKIGDGDRKNVFYICAGFKSVNLFFVKTNDDSNFHGRAAIDITSEDNMKKEYYDSCEETGKI